MATLQPVYLVPRTTNIIWAEITNVRAQKGIMHAEGISQGGDALPHGYTIVTQKHEHVVGRQ